MNIKKIIREEVDEFDWFKGSYQIPLNDYINIHLREKHYDIKDNLVGLKVMISKDSRWYQEGDEWNPLDEIGTITRFHIFDDGSSRIQVKWPNGKTNGYSEEDLDVILD
jgi:hypothetical protein